MELKNQCLPNDTLSLKCEFSCYSGMETYISENTFCNLDDFNSTEPQLSSASAIDISQKSTASPLGDDLKTLFDNQILCDVKLRTTTETFHAHKDYPQCQISSVHSNVYQWHERKCATMRRDSRLGRRYHK
ncbi:hypothetical protein CEXT_352711 [Caerostris extrusa]|uniref:Uncharacterized protein n=1 Tax=Caerostris extrusa TaxID=172846 RepID=A0AAV4USA5_CAEEX|nr:hypothetical protein CEXT_352711 [Caerostris extrusa]